MFRRKQAVSAPEEQVEPQTERPTSSRVAGPWDVDDIDLEDGVDRVDLGGLLLAPSDGRELRLQVDEASGQIASVMVTGPDGAVELMPFAAPRNGDLWSDVRPQI